jgi:S-adenosylmethionine hydrolase
VVLTNPEYQLEAPGATFAGRDIFAPAAAHLCNGVDLYELGDPIEPDLLLPGVIPLPREENGVLIAEVLWIDRFGNCQLNVGPDEVAGYGDAIRITIGDPSSSPMVRVAKRSDNFFGLGTGALGLVTDSYGMLALALDRRSAAVELDIGPHDQVLLEPIGDENTAVGTPVSSPVNLRIKR